MEPGAGAGRAGELHSRGRERRGRQRRPLPGMRGAAEAEAALRAAGFNLSKATSALNRARQPAGGPSPQPPGGRVNAHLRFN